MRPLLALLLSVLSLTAADPASFALPAPAAEAVLPGERFEFDGISCYTQGSGAPLLLVHSINAAGSAAEVRPLYERYRARRTVFAIDLPGYGHSLRSDRA